MTGYDCLKEELRGKGFTKQQIDNSKILPVVLDILSQSGNKYTEITAIEKDMKDLCKEVTLLQRDIALLNAEKDRIMQQIDRQKTEYNEYIDSFYKAIANCETAEGRDAVKIAQMFVNSVKVESKYDNTAYIIALGAILSKGKIAAMDELKKINRNLPWDAEGWITL